MTRGLETMHDLNVALDKSLDEMIRERKSGKRGRGRDRGREGGRGRGGFGRDDRMSNKFVHRNRYSAHQKHNGTNRNNNNRKNVNMRDVSNNNQGHNQDRRGKIGRGGYTRIGNRGMKRSFQSGFKGDSNNNPLFRKSGTQRGGMSQRGQKQRPSLQRKMNPAVTGTVSVRGLLPHVTSDDIKEIFETIGVVIKAYVKYDGKTGKSTGEGEVVYANRNDARKAQRELNGEHVDGTPITVRLAFQSSPDKFKKPNDEARTKMYRKKPMPSEVPHDPPNPLQR